MNAEKDEDIISLLDEATEVRKPNIKDAISKANSAFFNDDEIELTQAKTETSTTEVKPNSDTPAKTISTQDAKLSGETAAATTEFIASVISEFIIAVKTNKKFADGEKLMYNNYIRDADKANLTKDGLFLRQKGDRIMREKNEKLKEIEPTEKARQRLEAAYTKYYKITGKEMSPGFLLGAAITESLIKTISTAAID